MSLEARTVLIESRRVSRNNVSSCVRAILERMEHAFSRQALLTCKNCPFCTEAETRSVYGEVELGIDSPVVTAEWGKRAGWRKGRGAEKGTLGNSGVSRPLEHLPLGGHKEGSVSL